MMAMFGFSSTAEDTGFTAWLKGTYRLRCKSALSEERTLCIQISGSQLWAAIKLDADYSLASLMIIVFKLCDCFCRG